MTKGRDLKWAVFQNVFFCKVFDSMMYNRVHAIFQWMQRCFIEIVFRLLELAFASELDIENEDLK